MQLRNRAFLASAVAAFAIAAFSIVAIVASIKSIKSDASTSRTAQTATPAIPPPLQLSPPCETRAMEAPMPPFTNGYTVFPHRAGENTNYTSVPADRIEKDKANGRARDPLDFKTNVLNAACFCTADGNGLKEENKDQKFQNFCDGKSLNWCISTRATELNLDTYLDYFKIDEHCKPLNRQQAERYVILVASRDEIPAMSDEWLLYCLCEGHVSQSPEDDDSEEGPCTNRVNCWLVGPQGPIANNNPH